MTEAILVVGSSSTSCSACHRQVLPESKTHAKISGYGPEHPGCGALFVGISTGYPDVNPQILRNMRPDLPVVDFKEIEYYG
jgi:hypothetical protein